MYKVSKIEENAILGHFRANLGLVPFVIDKFISREVKDKHWDDLVSEGNMGLLQATEKFDTGRNIKFSTYATHFIYARIRRYIISSTHTIRVPEYLHYLIRKKDFKPTKPQHKMAQSAKNEIIQIDSLKLNDTDTPTGAYDSESLKEAINSTLDSLNSKNRKIVEFKLGLSGPRLTNKQIACILKIKEYSVLKKWKELKPALRDKLKMWETSI